MFNCNAFTNHLCITVSGFVTPCCRFKGFQQKFAYEKVNYVDHLTVNTNGWVTGCENCKLEEERGKNSYRNTHNENFGKSDKIEFLELSLSNICNLTCRMCGPKESDKWYNLIEENPELRKFFGKSSNSTQLSIDKLFSTIDLTNLTHIKYLGGEPFITPEFKILCDFLLRKNLIEGMSLWINTNITVFPTKVMKYLNQFKKVYLALSLDGIGNVNEYIRYGKSWDIIEKNIDNFVALKSNKIYPYIHTTVQAYNVHSIRDIIKFAERKTLDCHQNELRFPKHLAINALSPSYIDCITDEYNQDYFTNYSFDIDSNNKLQEFTTKMDNICNNNINNIIPLWKKNYDR